MVGPVPEPVSVQSNGTQEDRSPVGVGAAQHRPAPPLWLQDMAGWGKGEECGLKGPTPGWAWERQEIEHTGL